MAEAAQARVQDAVNKLVNDLDRSQLRRLQGEMHTCAAACCQRQEASLEQVHHCIEDCSKGVASAQTFIQGELNNFQERLQRCVLQCQDKVRDKILPSTTEAEVAKFRENYEQCVVHCADSHVDLIPNLFKRMKETLAAGKY